MSSYGEYLRRKVAGLPKTYGPSRYGDESLRTTVTRFNHSQRPSTAYRDETLLTTAPVTNPTQPTCCDTLHWRSTDYKVPSGGPYNGRNGDGQQQEWSVDAIISSRVCCAKTSGYITVGCCTPDRPSGIYYDASGNSLTKAYQGSKPSCCGFQGTRATALPRDCSCAVDPTSRQDTLAANDMPKSPLPYEVPQKACCYYTYKECGDNCCDEDGYLIPQ